MGIGQGLESVDDAQEVDPDRLAHLSDALVAALARVGLQLAGAVELLAVDRQELRGREEVVAGQARVRVRALLLQRQAAVVVRPLPLL